MANTLYLDPIWRIHDERDGGIIENAVHIDDVLDRLPTYFSAMRDLRFIDPGAYAFFSQIGAPLLHGSERTRLTWDGRIDEDFLQTLPTFSGFFFGPKSDEIDKEKIPAVALYMQKFTRCADVQPTNHTTYKVVMVWRDSKANARLKSVSEQLFVSISADGDIRVLRTQGQVRQKLPNNKGYIHHWGWVLPDWVYWHAREAGEGVNNYIRRLVLMAASARRDRDPIIVRCEKDGVNCAFTVHKQLASRFFYDREARDGKKRRILHYVRGHYREARGGEKFVRPHYRGERIFSWHNYRVKLSVPNWHHVDFHEKMDVGAYDDPQNEPPNMVDSDVVGAKLAKAMDRQRFLSRPKPIGSPR